MYPYTVATVSVIGLVYRTVPATLAAAAATSAIRDHVAAEAAWLRDLVRGDLGRGEGVLSTALDRAVQLHTRAGLRIELNAAGLGAGAVPPEAVEAIAGAVSELLTNVRKHAGTHVELVVPADTDGPGRRPGVPPTREVRHAGA